MDRWLIKKTVSSKQNDSSKDAPSTSKQDDSSKEIPTPTTSTQEEAITITVHSGLERNTSGSETDYGEVETKKIKYATATTKRKRNYKFVEAWLNLPQFKGWLSRSQRAERVNRFPALSEVIESQQVLDNEWRQHTLLDFSSMNMNTNCPEEYWKQIFKMKNATNTEIFPNLKKVINLLLILPFSNASVERVFSNLFNIKTDKRNFLSTNTVRGILSSKEGISLEGGCVKWEPSQKLYSGT
ncbi:unnamed protein product [Callosobruchus maculatus]|uniref:HAT C-terminal dimerisation domain-containing protein n=1 Tax=Callosobruchus maculatus TaxID=64391 RepID=A0A653CXH1_CALMS|nr:unnamed protein product [Callosobruchus maculatus]